MDARSADAPNSRGAELNDVSEIHEGHGGKLAADATRSPFKCETLM